MKLSTQRRFSIALLVIACTAGDALADKVVPSRKVFVGYLYGKPRNINYRLYTHLCHAFLLADGEGRLEPSRGVPDRGLTTEAHQAGVKVLVSLGGWGYDKQFAALTAKPEAEDRYVDAVLRIVDEGDYDGVDIDWEYPDTKDEVDGFERLVRRLREQLDAVGRRKERPIFLTMAASANRGALRWLRPDVLLQSLDWINVMTYDFAGDWTSYAGHNAPLFASPKQPGGRPISVADTFKYLIDERHWPADRLALGIPLYGRGFAVGAPYMSTKGAPKTHIPRGEYSNLQRLLSDQGWTRTWDDATKTPWLSNPEGSIVIGYDDPESASIKTRWAIERGLRGVFFWQIDGDRLTDGSNPVQQAVRRTFDEASKPSP